MSWNVGTKSIPKASADAVIDSLTTGITGLGADAMDDQLRVAKQAAKLLLANVPGPFVSVSLSGHANGVGWQKKEGWANDTITVTVSQMFEATQ